MKSRPDPVDSGQHKQGLLTECHRQIVWALAAVSDAIPVDLLADALYDKDTLESAARDPDYIDCLKRSLEELRHLGLVELRPDTRDLSRTSYILQRRQAQVLPCLVNITETGAVVAEDLRVA